MNSQQNNIVIRKVDRLKNPNLLCDAIYNNFIYLSKYPNLMHTKNEIGRLLTTPDNIMYLVYDNNKMIGYLIGEYKMLNDSRYVFYISYMFILDKYRNMKLGSRLMNKIIKECSDKGIKYILLTFDSNDLKLINFYQKHGFKKDPMLGNNGNNQIIMSLFL